MADAWAAACAMESSSGDDDDCLSSMGRDWDEGFEVGGGGGGTILLPGGGGGGGGSDPSHRVVELKLLLPEKNVTGDGGTANVVCC
jgi:hypothetical protein